MSQPSASGTSSSSSLPPPPPPASSLPPTNTSDESLARLLDQLDSGDVLLFDRSCMAMMHPLSTSLCGMAKLASRFDHVGIVFKLHDAAVPADSPVRQALRHKSPRGLYILEANLNGVTFRPLEGRLARTTSNAIAVRQLVGVTRDDAYHRAFSSRAAELLQYNYTQGLGDLMALFLDPPDKARRRETARQLLQIRAQIQNLRTLRGPDGGLLHDNVILAAMEKDCIGRYERLATAANGTATCTSSSTATGASTPSSSSSLPQAPFSIDGPLHLDADKGIVCSETVASCLQAVGVLAPYPTATSYLPKDFDPTRCHHRLVFASPDVSLGPTLFLSGEDRHLKHAHTRTDVVPVAALPLDDRTGAPVASAARAEVESMRRGLLRIGQAYVGAAVLTGPLLAKQVRLQLRYAEYVRGSLLSFVAVTAIRIACASSLHAQLCAALPIAPSAVASSAHVDLEHPFYDVAVRGGALGLVTVAAMLPVEALCLRYHFHPDVRWWTGAGRAALPSLLLSALAATSYCGAFCWPMVYESVIPFLLPYAPSLLRQPEAIPATQAEVDEERRLGINAALSLCVAHQVVSYPLDTMRLRYMMGGSPRWRQLSLGWRPFLLRGAITCALTYVSL